MYNLKNKKVSNTYCGFLGSKETILKKFKLVKNKFFIHGSS